MLDPQDTVYLALTGELLGVLCEYLCEKWPRYNGTALYMRKARSSVGIDQLEVHVKAFRNMVDILYAIHRELKYFVLLQRDKLWILDSHFILL